MAWVLIYIPPLQNLSQADDLSISHNDDELEQFSITEENDVDEENM